MHVEEARCGMATVAFFPFEARIIAEALKDFGGSEVSAPGQLGVELSTSMGSAFDVLALVLEAEGRVGVDKERLLWLPRLAANEPPDDAGERAKDTEVALAELRELAVITEDPDKLVQRASRNPRWVRVALEQLIAKVCKETEARRLVHARGVEAWEAQREANRGPSERLEATAEASS